MTRNHLILAAVITTSASATVASLVTWNVAPRIHSSPPAPSSLPQEALGPTVRIVELPGPTNGVSNQELEGELAQLRAELGARLDQIHDLEDKLAKLSSEPVPSTNQPSPTAEDRRPRRESISARLERMKEEEPERYEEMQKHREEFRDRMERTTAERAAFLLEVDTANMSEEQVASHEELVGLIEATWALQRQLRDDSAEVNHHDVRHELMANVYRISQLYGQEREYLLEQTGRELGYEGEEVQTFASHIQGIMDMTSVNPFGGGRGGSRGSGGPASNAGSTSAGPATQTAPGN